MNEENYEGLRKQLDNGSLDIPSQITILEIAYNLEQQLQSYKDKEDKLREYIYSVNNWNWEKLEGKNGTQIIREELLQILNEGDK